MKHLTNLLSAASASLLLAVPAQAMPDDAEELSSIIQMEYGSDANAYVEGERGDFRRMGCRGRTDLVNALLDQGLELERISGEPISRMISCVLFEEQAEVLALVINPQTMQTIERFHLSGWGWAPLSTAARKDNYDMVRLLLDNGASIYESTISRYGTREDHILYAAHMALENGRTNTLRAIEDAGFEPLVVAAQDESYVDSAMIVARGEDLENGSLFGGLAEVALGAALGGVTGDALMVAGGIEAVSSDESNASGVQPDFITPARIMEIHYEQEAGPTEGSSATTSSEIVEGNSGNEPSSLLNELDHLADLRDRGVLSEEEFEAMKARILEGM